MVSALRRNDGFSLVEVLVAVVLLSIGLLGLAKLQFWGVRHTGSAYFRTQATQIANEMAERLRANPGGVAAGGYALNKGGCRPAQCSTVPPDCRKKTVPTEPTCSPEQLAAFDVFSMACGETGAGDEAGADDLLPEGGMRVACSDIGNGKRRCRVEVCWDEADATDAESIVVLEVVP